MMQIQVLPFGVLKDWLGASPSKVELPEGATVADLLVLLSARESAPSLRGIAISVNAAYATGHQALHAGDEVGLLPPVSGGSGSPALPGIEDADAVTFLVRDSLDAETQIAAAGLSVAPPEASHDA
jgi:molybdopterin converting factor small subunit